MNQAIFERFLIDDSEEVAGTFARPFDLLIEAQNRRPRGEGPQKHREARWTASRFQLRVFGGASRARTGDLLAASQTLSQLSYGPWDTVKSSRSPPSPRAPSTL